MKYVIALSLSALSVIGAQAQTNNYTVANIVTNTQDPHLINPWGLSRPSSSHLSENEWWVSDQVTGLSTLYDANGAIVGLTVTIPPASSPGTGSPTGTVYNPSNRDFAFVTLDGTLSVWSSTATPSTPGPACAECHVTSASIAVNNGTAGASYQGLTIAKNATTGALAYYAANSNGGVEVYDATSFARVALPTGAFNDPSIPTSYSPAGIQAIGSDIYVTYNAISGGGTGYVDAFNSDGKLLHRLQNGWFDQPWGVAVAPAKFGAFSNDILVGNTGSGWIGAYNRKTGDFEGFLQSNGVVLTIPGLWGLSFGDGSTESGPTTVLYFSAGGANLTTGTFGAIAVP